MVPVFNTLRAANCDTYAILCHTTLHSGCTVVLTLLTFAVPKHDFQLIRSIGVAKGEKNVGLYVGLLVRVITRAFLQ